LASPSCAWPNLPDVGCGDGVLAGEIARRGSVVTGLDADALMIAAAGRQAEASQFQLHFLVGRAENLPFPDATFNRVLAVTTLCFVQDAEQAIGEMARVLKPGGSLVIGELGRGAFGPLTDEFELGSVIRLGGWQDSARRLDFAALCPPPVWT
jgi:ubiquinone/menaquinone biosynthesis C-methylase UbiE